MADPSVRWFCRGSRLSRRLRVSLDGMPLHVVQRGDPGTSALSLTMKEEGGGQVAGHAEGGPLIDPLADKRIVAAFVADVRPRAVAGDELDIVAERPEALADGADQGGVVAAREVGAADRALEQHVADDRQMRGRVMEDSSLRRLARRRN